MLNKGYPLHDMNKVFDMFSEQIMKGGCADNTSSEMLFLNKLFASLPVEAVEYGMRFLNGDKDLPSSCDEIMPLYIRFVSFAEYLEKIEKLREIPEELSNEAIMERQKMIESLEEHEKAFLAPLLGFKFDPKEENISEAPEEEARGSSNLHLMNSSACIFVCENPMRTSVFYEEKLGFKASHLEDEKMPHIRLTRDNIVILLVKGSVNLILSKISEARYDLYIYANEPFLLQNELRSNGVTIREELPEAQKAQSSTVNRQFVFEDIDGRKICCSQSTEII